MEFEDYGFNTSCAGCGKQFDIPKKRGTPKGGSFCGLPCVFIWMENNGVSPGEIATAKRMAENRDFERGMVLPLYVPPVQ